MFGRSERRHRNVQTRPRRADAPDQGYWLTLDADGAALPSDWYLRLGGEITRMFHGEIKPSATMPSPRGSHSRVGRCHIV
jgi:hypothetical protein